MPPAARVTDMHTCPMFTGPVPHVGGPILPPGAPTVLIDFLPAATVTNMLTCVGPPDVIVKGSAGVFINYLPAARMGDLTAHGGVIVLGAPNVIIGEIGSPSPGAAGLGAVVAGMVMSGIGTPDQENASLLSTSNPLAAHGHGGPHKKPAANPCAGKGLDTPANQKEFAADMKTLQKDWPKLSPAQREDQLKAMVNKQLAKSGVPTVNVTEDKTLDLMHADGMMDTKQWTLNINPNLMASPRLSSTQITQLSRVLYHEGRHAEQFYLMAREKAITARDAQEIAATLGVNKNVAYGAFQSPLPPHDPMKKCAQSMYQSVYGNGSQHREDVLFKRMMSHDKLDAANEKVREVNENPASTEEQVKTALGEWMDALSENLDSIDAYKALPTEADAFQTGNGVGDLHDQ